jgi:dissimilatory sulfite reductase (desulfoviridin) alpha/beta subunit
VVKKILAVYKADARDWERVGEWVERIGWPAQDESHYHSGAHEITPGF